ncbi:tRNA pseudouridine(55) synthase TruB [Candidatus Pantoea edessiphila]|uniref:tRNA pseudouridine synthase B n=1 Tax=Candidatus Pantoea edessiphila TaxID=2044610 RepID=A0A2P5T030_9GAMM|nr:tRNA pseudouridine(55) synthase TruB [Candidatus Pantoea edessiphila]PPI87935.1 tRNA pseudouridine(55) synthase TruB [Candidatus Pantoea edessiphila]
MYFSCPNVNGVLLLDKSKGVSSNYALQEVRRIFNFSKAGYTGTLDPLATGMLPICFGSSTKFSRYLLDSDKRYLVTAKLGKRTDTSDCYGKILKESPILFNREQLNNVLKNFRGNISQVPSMFSALKHQGIPLYKYARKGIIIQRKERLINVYKLKVIKWDNDELELDISCSKGTYIRTLIEDIGEQLGCSAYVIALRRLQVAKCSLYKMLTLDQLNKLFSIFIKTGISLKELIDQLILPIDSQLSHLPVVNLLPLSARRFKQGQLIFINKLTLNGLVRVTEGTLHKFIGIAKIAHNGYIAPQCLLNND